MDESGTRLMINSFLSDVLGYRPLEEIKTEYMIKGTYADYVIQVNNIRHFLVEVKALSFALSEKHLRQTINYGANEGIEYALLTNGRDFEFYKILFDKPIEARRIFSFDLSNTSSLKPAADYLQHLHKDSTIKHFFKPLWNKCEATDPLNVAGMLISDNIVSQLKKMIKAKYNEKCDDDVIMKSLHDVIVDRIDFASVRPFKAPKTRSARSKKVASPGPSVSEIEIPKEAEQGNGAGISNN